MFKNKKVLVAGGTGLIGIHLVNLLIKRGAEVRIVSLDDPSRAHPQAEFVGADLRYFDTCLKVCKGMDYVFNLLCAKGSPALTAKKPASLFVPNLMFGTALAEAARLEGVKGYLFTSSVAVYPKAKIFKEDEAWRGWPSENDRPAGWAKRMGELQIEFYRTEYGLERFVTVRPSNVYGPYDNFDSPAAMVVPALIRKVLSGIDPIVIDGNGLQKRDIIHANDVARGMLLVMEKDFNGPINLGSGQPVSIRRLLKIIISNSKHKPRVVFDESKPSGDAVRLMDISRAKSIGFNPEISLEDGIKETVAWYLENKDKVKPVFNSITSNK